ncbi:hypothetical protein HYALB_00005827 [Hymenoscyphus albidus]|uniref:Uncharacterized protein n=1 Tax=Hymenoscyphus albidus TaxID=595503 RepID=A0A9N9LG21_9HELO|nr:hypothetical protein HYALB_00005827 [Hymenoscyphus albidus]
MGWFGDLPMASAFAIVLGCLIAATFIAGFIKVCYNKRRLTKHEKLDELKLKGKGPKGADQEMLNTRETDEGDLFGVRALEAGYFGGVAQSRPSSPAGSRINSYVLTPNGENSANSITSDLPLSPGIQAPKATKPKPSPLRLQPTDPNFRPPSAGGKSPSYMPLSGLSKSPSSATQQGAPAQDWVSPIDARLEQTPQPTSPASIASSQRPKSYLPKLNFPENKEPDVDPAPEASKVKERVIEVRSPTTSIAPGSPNSTYQQYIPTRAGRSPARSMFPTESHRDRSSSRNRGTKEDRSESPARGAKQSSPLAMDNDHLPEHNPEWDNERPVIRDSIVSKKGVSVTTPTETTFLQAKNSNRKSDASSVYSTTNGADWNAREQGAKVKEGSRGRTNSNSPSRSRSRSKSLAGARNSIRQSSHQRNDSSKSSHRISRDRDQIHYDPTPQSRNRSGSVHGRAVDFNQPRASPFSKATATPPSHSHSTSVTSFGPRKPSLGLGLLSAAPPATQDKDRLSVMSTARGRSDSDASQASMGDFYDAYYRQSTISHRASAYQPARPESFTADLSNQSVIDNGFNFDLGVTRKAPPPSLGLKLLDVGETIVEVPSPDPTASERFPSRV